MRAAATLLLFGLLAAAAIVDRIEIAVASATITELQLEEELAVTAFLNHALVASTPNDRRAAAHRLIQQTLITREMQLAQFPGIESRAVDSALNQVKTKYRKDGEYQAALNSYMLTEDILRQHLETQVNVLRFVEYRFRPELSISDPELQAEYNREAANWDTNNPHQIRPDFESSRGALRARIAEERTDEALDTWLSQADSQVRITYIDPDLKPIL